MKILVYGAGVLGCNLARNLLRAGKDVTLLARENWAAEIKQNGLRIKDKFSLRTSVSRIPVVKQASASAYKQVAVRYSLYNFKYIVSVNYLNTIFFRCFLRLIGKDCNIYVSACF